MEPHIERNNGFVDKFIGDAIMALFSGEAENALRCANEMREELGRYNIYRKGQGFQAINTGIGINTGELILGDGWLGQSH